MLAILKDVVRGMTFLHGSHIIHNDLKAQNVLVDCHNAAKVADFGLATLKSDKDASTVGTPYWMAPERLRKEATLPASDVYSFGITIFEVFCLCSRILRAPGQR